jgi:hypothetical protein
MKRFFYFAILAAIMLSFTACSKSGIPEITSAVTYMPEDIKYHTVEPLEKPEYYVIEWQTPTASDVYSEASAIVRGAPVSSSEFEVSYLYGDETRVDYYTVLEFEISDVYYDKSGSLKEGGRERVLYILSSYFSSKNAVTFTSEGDYILILRPLAGWDKNIYGLENIADYNIVYPKLIVDKTGEYYDAQELADVFLYGDETESPTATGETTAPGTGEQADYSNATFEQVEGLIDIILSGKK